MCRWNLLHTHKHTHTHTVTHTHRELAKTVYSCRSNMSCGWQNVPLPTRRLTQLCPAQPCPVSVAALVPATCLMLTNVPSNKVPPYIPLSLCSPYLSRWIFMIPACRFSPPFVTLNCWAWCALHFSTLRSGVASRHMENCWHCTYAACAGSA